MHPRYLESIRSFEGFTREAKWDYAQHSNGFGTKALHPGEQITLEEAKRRFAAEIEQARKFVERHARDWDEGTKAALTSLTFNAGTKWASSGLGEAVRNLDVDAVRSRFLAYTKAGGEDLPGLVRRRLAEVMWIGEQQQDMQAAKPAVFTATTASSTPASPDRADQVAGIGGEAAPTRAQVAEMPHAGAADAEAHASADPLSLAAWWLMLLDLHRPGDNDRRERDVVV